MGMYADLKAIPKQKLEAYFDNDFEDENDEFDPYPSCDLDKIWGILNFVLISSENDMANIELLENAIFAKECYNPTQKLLKMAIFQPVITMSY